MESQQSPVVGPVASPASGPVAKEDLSSKTILVLVVLVVIVSVIGAWVNFSLYAGSVAPVRSSFGSSSAQVGFNIVDNKPVTDNIAGRASFTILDK